MQKPHVLRSRRLPPGLALATVRCGAPGGSGPWSWEALTLLRWEDQPRLGSVIACIWPFLLIN